jgi:Fe(3+) dicitrate transport protein
MSKQFTDSSNAISGNLSGVIGQIPSYKILDLSTSYYFKNFTFESGVNNLLNEKYFTRRATGYPGPGIIPSSPRTFYFTIEIKI